MQAGAACSGDGTYTGQSQAAILRQKKAYFCFKAQPNCLQVSPALPKHCKAAAWWAAVSSPGAGAQHASQDAFPSRWDHRLPQGSRGILYPCPRHRIWPARFQRGFRKAPEGGGGLQQRHRRRSLWERQGSKQGCWGKMLLPAGIGYNPHEPASLAEAISKIVTRLPKTCDIKPKTLLDFISLGCDVLQHSRAVGVLWMGNHERFQKRGGR